MSSAVDSSQDKAATDPKRQRGVEAQREYRKRHANKFKSLQEENQRLKDAIKDISRVASRCNSLQQDLRDVIAIARTLAGITGGHDLFKDVMPTKEVSNNIVKVFPSVAARREVPSVTGSPGTSLALVHNGHYLDLQKNQFFAKRMNPSPSPILWLDSERVVEIFDSPMDVAPFLGDGLYTFAGCLYWACISHAVSLWRRAKFPGQARLTEQERYDNLFNHSRLPSDQEFLVALARTQLDHRRQGYVTHRISGQDPSKEDVMEELYIRLHDEFAKQGKVLDWWKSAQEVETYVRKNLEPRDWTTLQSVLRGRGTGAEVKEMAPLVEALAQNFICFGDGPRWNAVHVSVTVGAWLKHRQHACEL